MDRVTQLWPSHIVSIHNMKTDATVILYLFRLVPELSPVLPQIVCNGNPLEKGTTKRWHTSALLVQSSCRVMKAFVRSSVQTTF